MPRFVGSLWSPAKTQWNNIIADINSTYPVIYSKVFKYDSFDAMSHDIIEIYKTDDIAISKVKNVKLNAMKNNDYEFMFFMFDIDVPNYRNKKNGNQISTKIEQIKKQIRTKYKHHIHNYIYDIIVHMTDNEQQTTEIIDFLFTSGSSVLNIHAYLQTIAKYQYCIIKYEVPYMPKDFPHKYPIGKDLDLIVHENDFDMICQATRELMEPYKNYVTIKEIKRNGNWRCRVEYKNKLHYQIDISTKLFDLDISAAVNRRIANNDFFVLHQDDEYQVRLHEIKTYPKKKHHHEWIKQYKS